MNKVLQFFVLFFSFNILACELQGQHSVAREWNEVLLHRIRGDFARPTIHARNLWHSSAMMYDIWSLFDDEASPYFLGNVHDGFEFQFDGFDITDDKEAKIHEAISFAMFRLLEHRFKTSPEGSAAYASLVSQMIGYGYEYEFVGTDYSQGDAAGLGNYVASLMIKYGRQDGSREQSGYNNAYYEPLNDPMVMLNSGNPNLEHPNNWQQLTLDVFIDQSGNEVPFNTPDFLSPEWGNVTPFALSENDKTVFTKNGTDVYNVYLDPGPPPYIDLDDPEGSYEYIRGFEMVLKWSSQMDPSDGIMVDISPASNGNNAELPTNATDILSFYDYENGGDYSEGHDQNPVTGLPYEPQVVPFGDYTRVLAEFWADGPDSETPPGHWFSILNYVNDHPMSTKQYEGVGDAYSDLEWDVKSYFMLGGGMHDAAISAWGVKGYYDYIRPVSAIRYIASLGQRSDSSLPSYSPLGFALEDDFIELVYENDPLVGPNMVNLHKLKVKAWRGPDYIQNPDTDQAGVGWILIEDWWPYQRPSFVTPPFAGYVSGHSTFSRAAAELLTKFTGSEFFPGGLGRFNVEQNEFLVFEEGPSTSFELQWATYRDASDETSLSRIWGGIHPPADDIPGRIMGVKIADRVFDKSESYFFVDNDKDGFYSYEDCNDNDPFINPMSSEVCDDVDNDCNGLVDDELPLFTYYLDSDNDGYGNADSFIEICREDVPEGYSLIAQDCNDDDPSINPMSNETCDDIDNDCNGLIDDALPLNTYYVDNDADGYGNANDFIEICSDIVPEGYCTVALDCNDDNPLINPLSSEICDDIDNDCNGLVDDNLPLYTYYRDVDNDGFGDQNSSIEICEDVPPTGYSTKGTDCDDENLAINPNSTEICDNIDNNCSGAIDDGIQYYNYYRDNDNDGFGNLSDELYICEVTPPEGYVRDSSDCDDDNNDIYPGAPEVSDNGIDEDCNGIDFYEITKVYPNPFSNQFTIHLNKQEPVQILVINSMGQLVFDKVTEGKDNVFFVDDFDNGSKGVFYLYIIGGSEEVFHHEKLVRI